MKKVRKTNIELLKIIAIILIVLCHCMPSVSGNISVGGVSEYLFDLSLASTSGIQILFVFMKYGGQIGNAIFIVCSSWFLLNDLENRKYDLRKLLLYILNCFVISVIILLLVILLGYKLNTIIIIKQLFPILFENNWYVTCYIVFYLIYPGLNLVIRALNQKELLGVCAVMFGMYNIVNFIIAGRYFYTNLVGFICIYFYVAYIKKYLSTLSNNRGINAILFVVAFFLHIGLIIFTNIIGIRIEKINDWTTKWNVFMNPFIVIISISLFNLIRNTEIKENSFIISLSSKSLLIYIIHCNYLIMNFIKFDFYKYIYYSYGYSHIILCSLAVAFIMFWGSLFVAYIYDAVMKKIIEYLTLVIYKVIQRQFEILYKKVSTLS